MRYPRTRFVRTATVLAGVAAGAALLLPATATAAPEHGGLLETTCSWDQLEAAARVEAPEFAARLDAHPEFKAKLQELIALPVDQRKARLQQLRDEHPKDRARIEERRNSPEAQARIAKIRAITDTCHNY